jgi:type I restriction enzyme, S subunit
MSSGWPKVRIGNVAEPIERPERPIPGVSYRQVGVRLWGAGAYEREPLDGGATKYKALSRVKAGDIIVNKIWARNGSVSVISDALEGCYCSGEFPLFRPKPDQLEPRWFFWITKARWFWDLCDVQSRGTSGKNRIRPERFLEIPIPIPPLPEQRRIVAKIADLTSKLQEASDLRYQSSEETGTLTRCGIERHYRRLCTLYGARPLHEICKTITDGDHNTPAFTDDGVPFIFVGNISSGFLHFESSKRVSLKYFESLKAHRVPEQGDILYSAVGATLGVPALVDTDEAFCFQRHIAILKPDRSVLDARFAWHMLRSQTVFEKAWSSTTGTAQPTVPLRAIRQLQIPCPSLQKQSGIVGELDDFLAHMGQLREAQSKSKAALNALLPSILDCAFAAEL